MLISIIVPVYNTEEYLPVCIESILSQTYKNIEIVLVDDGSKDRSVEICKEYEKKDARIVVIQRKHQGVVAAKRAAIEKAKGKYCVFVDSDDWIADNLLEVLLPLTDNGNVDIVNYNMRSVKGTVSTKWEYTIPEGVYEYQDLNIIYEKMMFDFEKGKPGIIQSLCTKLIKKEVLDKSIIIDSDNISIGDDAAIVYKAMLMSKKVVITNECFYYYRVNPNSLCHTKDVEFFSKLYSFQQYMISVFSPFENKYNLNKQLQAYLISCIEIGIKTLFSIEVKNLYQVPMHLLTNDDRRIVLYGAGDIGKSYYRKMKNMRNIDIVAWIDEGQKGSQIYEYEIKSPEILKDLNFDKLLIAAKGKSTVEEIRKRLNKYVLEEQTLWEEDINWREKEIIL